MIAPPDRDRRAGMLDRLADFVLANGLSAASLRPLADAAGTSDRMLIYYFKDKASLIAATLAHIAARMTVLMERYDAGPELPPDELLQQLNGVLFGEEFLPYMRVWLEVASLAAWGDPVFREIGGQIGRGFLAWGEARLDSPTPAAKAIDAAQLLVRLEGRLLLRSVGLEDVCALADRKSDIASL